MVPFLILEANEGSFWREFARLVNRVLPLACLQCPIVRHEDCSVQVMPATIQREDCRPDLELFPDCAEFVLAPQAAELQADAMFTGMPHITQMCCVASESTGRCMDHAGHTCCRVPALSRASVVAGSFCEYWHGGTHACRRTMNTFMHTPMKFAG